MPISAPSPNCAPSVKEVGGVDVDAGGIYFAAEPVGMSFVFGYDTFAVFGTILLYVCYGAVHAFNDFHSQFVVQKFRTEILFRGFFQQFRRGVSGLAKRHMQTYRRVLTSTK